MTGPVDELMSQLSARTKRSKGNMSNNISMIMEMLTAPVSDQPSGVTQYETPTGQTRNKLVNNFPTGSNSGTNPNVFGDPKNDKLSTINFMGKKVTVNQSSSAKFQALSSALAKAGYKVNSVGGYVVKGIEGASPGVQSMHSYGRAIDVNPSDNPFSYNPNNLKTNLPSNIGQIASSLGLVWGGDWKKRKDPMHFEDWG